MNYQINKLIKATFLLLMLVFLTASSFGQKKDSPIMDLKIGDSIPGLSVKNLINSSKKNIKVSELYKNGLLIINFWATWCKPCIAELPLLDTLKNKFNNNLNVLSVAYEDSTIVKSFLKAHDNIHVTDLLMITNDTLFVKYFKHKYLPHNVWIDHDGVVRAITNAEEINEKNVKEFINKKETTFNIKQDKLNFDYTKTFHLGDSIFQYRSISTKYINGIPSGCASWGTHIEGMKRIFIFNYKIIDMFSLAFHRNARAAEDYNLTEIHTKDSIKFFRPEQIHNLPNRSQYKRRIDWEKEYLYCYDLTIPNNISDTLFYQYMMDDLKRMFNVSCIARNRPMVCNVVSSISGSKYSLTNYHSTHHTTSVELFKRRLTLQHATVKDLVDKILGTFKDRDIPWVDESGITFPLDLVINFDPGTPITMEVVKNRLLEYGLKVKQEVRLYPVMVLEDLNK